MGYAKEKWIREEGRGWRDGPDRCVCAKCADDPFLAEQVQAAASSCTCDYCEAESADGKPIAAPVNVLLEIVGNTVNTYWNDPAGELPYETAEGGYQGELIYTEELLTDYIGMDWPQPLLDDVVASLTNDVWCKRHYFSLDEDDRLRFGWRDFQRITKHQSRFASLLPPLDPDEWVHPDNVPASQMLDEVASAIRICDLFKEMPAKTKIFRARAHDPSNRFEDAKALGPPAPEQAKFANRMSAAGIAVFYGALESETALVETFDATDADRSMATVGFFWTARSLRVLDLCDIPEIPSYFDLERAGNRDALLFLHEFVESVSKRTLKDGREHIEYVPTQIFAEFVRHRLRLESGESIDGILYPSAQVDGGRCCVLFCDQAECGGRSPEAWEHIEPWLTYEGGSAVRVDNEACNAAIKKAAEALKAGA